MKPPQNISIRLQTITTNKTSSTARAPQQTVIHFTLQQVVQQLSYFTAGCALDDDDYDEFNWSPAKHIPQT